VSNIKASRYCVNRGSWFYSHARVAHRYYNLPEHSCHNLGVRLVEEVEEVDPPSGSNRVDRGGSWYSVAANARVAFRNYNSPGDRYQDLGVRLVEET
jgi:formylglycine-generating enzyme required for sulfatase activity